jgi:hypothetical protein
LGAEAAPGLDFCLYPCNAARNGLTNTHINKIAKSSEKVNRLIDRVSGFFPVFLSFSQEKSHEWRKMHKFTQKAFDKSHKIRYTLLGIISQHFRV